MCAALVKADETYTALTETKIVHCRFPIMKLATEAVTEMLRDLWHQVDTQSATAFFNNWYNRVKLEAKLEYSSYQTHSRRCEGALSVL